MGKGGKGGGVDLDEVERLAGIQGDIAEGLFDETTPLRQTLLSQLGGFVGVPQPSPVAATAPPATTGPGFITVPESVGDEGDIEFTRVPLGPTQPPQRFATPGMNLFGINLPPDQTTAPPVLVNPARQPGGALSIDAATTPPPEAGELPPAFAGLFGETPGALPEFAQPFFGEQPGDLPAFAQDFFGEDGQIPPFLLPAFAPVREATEAQFERARENILGTGVRGGQLRQALGDVELGRAQAVGALEAPLRQQLFNQELALRQNAANQQLALQQGLFGQELGLTGDLFNAAQGVAFGAPQTALGGLNAATGNLANVAQIGAQQQAAGGQALGELAGLGLKAGLLFGSGGTSALGAPFAPAALALAR